MALVSIDELMGRSFHIPSYQRGYRWGKVEVEAFLNDLKEFYLSNPKTNEFYCLQPIVLYNNPKKHEQELLNGQRSTLELLDGQQRLTTIYILATYLEDARDLLGLGSTVYSITYATRNNSEEFLKNKKFKTDASDNIDYYYMAQAYKVIKKWFEENEENKQLKGKIATILFQKKGIGANVRVIEYVLQDDSDPIEVFLRLNQGKIPLTDAELVKAALLQRDKYKEEDLKTIQPQLDLIAGEWYDIERALAEPDRWAFIAPKEDSIATRIDLILRLVAKRLLKKERNDLQLPKDLFENTAYKHPCYIVFAEWIKKNENRRIECIREIWEEVHSVYEFIDEWYNEHTLYHYIGFLLCEKVITLESLLEKAMKSGRSTFEKYLLKEISKSLGENTPSSLSYENEDGKKKDYVAIMRLLLLHNIYWCVKTNNKDKLRFSFSAYRKKRWSLEHITPQNPEAPTDLKAMIEWVDSHLTSLRSREVKQEENKFITNLVAMQEKLKKPAQSKDDFVKLQREFEVLFEEVLNYEQQLPENKLHSLGNLCLLDGSTNISLSNNSFDVKREMIRMGGLKDAYIPPATRQVFLKGFSAYPKNNYFWDEADAESYLKVITETYNYFKQKER